MKNIFHANVGFWDTSILNNRNNNCITININTFSDSDDAFDLFEYPATIMGEDETYDVERYYEPIANNYVNRHFDGLLLKYESGKTLVRNYERFIDKHNKFCVALADSDILYEGYTQQNSDLSITLPNCDQDNNRPFNCIYYILKVREVENLVPLELFLLFKQRNMEDFSSINYLLDLINGNSIRKEKVIKYYDYSEGIHDKPLERNYWESVLGITITKDDLRKSVATKKKLRELVKNNKNDLESLNVSDDGIMPNFLRQEWEKIGEIIFSRCCALKFKSFYRYRRLVRTDNLIDYKRVNWYSTILRISTSKIVSI